MVGILTPLHSLADAHHACGQGVAHDVAAEAAQQHGRAIQRHAELVLARDDPGLRLLSEEAPRDDASWCRRDLQAQVTAGASVLEAVVLQNAHLFGDDVELLTDLRANLHQRVPIMGAHALGLGEGLAEALLMAAPLGQALAQLATTAP